MLIRILISIPWQRRGEENGYYIHTCVDLDRIGCGCHDDVKVFLVPKNVFPLCTLYQWVISTTWLPPLLELLTIKSSFDCVIQVESHWSNLNGKAWKNVIHSKKKENMFSLSMSIELYIFVFLSDLREKKTFWMQISCIDFSADNYQSYSDTFLFF